MTTPALDRLVADPAALDAAWGRAPLLTRAADLPRGFTDLLAADDVDEMLADRALRQPAWTVVSDGDTRRGLTRTVNAGGRRLADVVDPDAVAHAWAGGATLVLNALHRSHPPLVAFCRGLAADLGHPVQCNAYVTPPGRARGFRFHHDTHDVLVLQVGGRKHWVVHEPVTPLPAAGMTAVGDHLVPDGATPLLDTELVAGDVLYLPRGYVHAARSADEASVHLTIGVHATTWLEVLREVTELAREEPPFRESLPLRPADSLGPDALPGFRDSLVAWLQGLDVAALAERVDARARRAVPVEPLRALAQVRLAATLHPATALRPREGLRWSLADVPDRPDRCVLVLPDRRVEVPAAVGPAVARALAGPTTPATLGAADVGVDEADALVLLRRLVREGALVGEGLSDAC